MAVSPSFPTPSLPEFPQAGEPRHDAVSPSFPEFPHEVPPPVSPRPIKGRGNGETAGEGADDHQPSLPSEAHARERSAQMDDQSTIPGDLPDWLAPHGEEVASWGPAPTAPTCWVAGCRRDAHLHGLCKTHHLRATRTWNPRPSHRAPRRKNEGGKGA